MLSSIRPLPHPSFETPSLGKLRAAPQDEEFAAGRLSADMEQPCTS